MHDRTAGRPEALAGVEACVRIPQPGAHAHNELNIIKQQLPRLFGLSEHEEGMHEAGMHDGPDLLPVRRRRQVARRHSRCSCSSRHMPA